VQSYSSNTHVVNNTDSIGNGGSINISGIELSNITAITVISCITINVVISMDDIGTIKVPQIIDTTTTTMFVNVFTTKSAAPSSLVLAS
jgi:hypothetical protein